MIDFMEHLRGFMRRRYEGISTAELDTCWGDTIGNWRERPPELEKEKKFRFLLWRKDEYWLIFERSYYNFELPHLRRRGITIHLPQKSFRLQDREKKRTSRLHRLPDYIAVNRQTSEIRRFVDVSRNEVLDDLQGIYPSPAQAELTRFWGKRKPSGIREETRERFYQQFQDKQGFHISKLIHLADFPFYGPVGNPFDLTLRCSFSLSVSSLNSLSNVRFVYARSSQTPIVAIEFEVGKENTLVHTFTEKDTSNQALSFFQLAQMFFQSKNQSGKGQEVIEKISSWQGTLIIAGNSFTGKMYHQSLDHLSWFILLSEKTRLMGKASGLSEEELFQWLEMLHIINQEEDVLLSYQREYDEDRQQVESDVHSPFL